MTWPVVVTIVTLAWALVAICACALVGANREAERRDAREKHLTNLLFSRDATAPEVRAFAAVAAERNGHGDRERTEREPAPRIEAQAEDGTPVVVTGLG